MPYISNTERDRQNPEDNRRKQGEDLLTAFEK